MASLPHTVWKSCILRPSLSKTVNAPSRHCNHISSPGPPEQRTATTAWSRNSSSPGCRGQMSETKGSAVRSLSWFWRPQAFLGAQVQGPNPVFIWRSPCVSSHPLPSAHVGVQCPFYKDTNHLGLGLTLMTLFKLIISLKTPSPNKITFGGAED